MFKHQTEYVLENKITKLSPLDSKHIAPLYEVANDKEIWTYFIENGYGRDNFTNYINQAIENRRQEKEYPFVIFDKSTNRYAGTTRLYDLSNTLGNIKIGHTWIGRDFQGTGLNKNCKYLLFEFLFDQMNMKRIGFGASSENETSIAAMKSVGCKQEGILRSFLPSVDGTQRVDIVLMSILNEEWNASAKESLKRKINKYN